MKLFQLGAVNHQLYHAEDYNGAAKLAAREGHNLHAGLVWSGTLLDGDGERIYRTVLDKDRLSNFPSASQVYFVRANSYGDAEKAFATIGDVVLSNITTFVAEIIEAK